MATSKVNNIILAVGGSSITVLLAIIAFFLVKNYESQENVAAAVQDFNVLVEIHSIKLEAYEKEKSFFMNDYSKHKLANKIEHTQLQNKIYSNEKSIIRLYNTIE